MDLFDFHDWNYLAAAAAVVVGALAGLIARRLVLRRLKALATGTSSKAREAFVASLRGPLPIWFTLAGMYFGARFIEFPGRWAATVDTVLTAVAIVSVTLWLAAVAVRLLVATAGESQARTPITGVMLIFVRLLIYTVGVVVLLNSFGLSIAPVLTTFGIGGVAVALGLQDTLSNLFAGMHIALSGNVRVGDFIELDSGQQGYVEDIRWRSTRIRTLPNDFLLVPNSLLAKSIVTNHHLPSKDLAVPVEVGVHYRSDLGEVERIACEVGAEVMRTCPGGVPGFAPFVRYHTFGESSVNFTMILRAREFEQSFIVKHDFIKALSRRFAREGIVIPFPIRALNMEQEQPPGTPSSQKERAARRTAGRPTSRRKGGGAGA